MAAPAVDWEFWLTLPQVKAWQAVALSMGFDPDRMNQSRDYWKQAPDDHDVPNVRARERFGERLRLLIAGRQDSQQFSVQSSSLDTPANHRVVLREVAAWLRALDGAPIDAEFLAAIDGTPLASIATTTTTAAAPAAAAPRTTPTRTTALSLQQWQEDQLLRTTRSLGYDPLGLPPDDASRTFCVKSVIRERCASNHPVKMRQAIFNKAWDRMLARSPAALRYAAASPV